MNDIDRPIYNLNEIEFLGSFPSIEHCPEGILPEYAFIGRSNVGKSSLINLIMGRKDMARVSKQPGKTQAINLYEIDKKWRIADLPGYGFAKVSKKERLRWKNMIDTYLLNRQTLAAVFLLLDFRIKPQEIDMEFAASLGANSIPFTILFTKADKLKKGERRKKLSAFIDRFTDDWAEMPEYIITSSARGEGRIPLIQYIMEVNEAFYNELDEAS